MPRQRLADRYISSLFGCTIFMQLDLATNAVTLTTFLTPGLTASSRQLVFGGLVGQVRTAASAAHSREPPLPPPLPRPRTLQMGADVYSFASDAAMNGTVQLTAQRVAAMMAGQAYINLGTSQYPAGETRGQICFATCGLAMMTTVQVRRGARAALRTAAAHWPPLRHSLAGPERARCRPPLCHRSSRGRE